MFITEQAFLMTTRADGAAHLRISLRDEVLRSALLCDLAAHNLIVLEDRGLLGKRVRPAVPAGHVDDPLLRHGVERLEQLGPRSVQRLLKDKRFATEEAVTLALVTQAPGGTTVLREGQNAMGFLDTRKTLKEIKYSVTDPALERTSALVAETLTAALSAMAAIARRQRHYR